MEDLTEEEGRRSEESKGLFENEEDDCYALYDVALQQEDDIHQQQTMMGFAVEEEHQEHEAMNSHDTCLPPQLHPSVIRGIRKVSSCYFSIGEPSEASNSVADLLSLLGDDQQYSEVQQDHASQDHHEYAANDEWNASDVLYHDILMNVLNFLDQSDLRAFSETARRPNFECFYFLQLQLQRALVVSGTVSQDVRNVGNGMVADDNDGSHDHCLGALSGTGCITRLSLTDSTAAQQIVQDYIDSNSTLRIMPLSHSLAYMRYVLARNGFHYYMNMMSNGNSVSQTTSRQKALASAAFLITLVGAASFMSAASGGGGFSSSSSIESLQETCTTLFRVGLATGSLVGAASASKKMKESVNAAVQQNLQNDDDDHNGGGEDDHDDDDHDDDDRDDGNDGMHGEDNDNRNMTMRETAEYMAHMMQEMPSRMLRKLHELHQSQKRNPEAIEDSNQRDRSSNDQNSIFHIPSFFASRLYAVLMSAQQEEQKEQAITMPQKSKMRSRSKRTRVNHTAEASSASAGEANCAVDSNGKQEQKTQMQDELALHVLAMKHPLTPNPYDHLQEEQKQLLREHQSQHHGSTDKAPMTSTSRCLKKMPSGCVGAYSRAVQQATKRIIAMVKEERRSNFEALSLAEQVEVSRTFLDACASDDSLAIIKDMVQVRQILPIDNFFVGADGNETCGLHAAAYHGAYRVLEFLCQGIEEDSDLGGGLADVDVTDANGFTALHFAAGNNSVEAVRILAAHGAKLAVEAGNGYTPYHWAQRLSNSEVAEELHRLGADQRFQPLSTIAGRFFGAMIPSPA